MRSPAATLARIAARQRGRITTEQLVRAGVDRHRIKRWVADGRLSREHIGVYTLGHPDTTAHGVYMSACLAGGRGAHVSHAAAAHLLNVIRGAPPRSEVVIPTTAHRARPGIVIHRVKALPPLDVSTLDGIPITIVPRVLLDLAPRLAPPDLARACHEAWVHHRTSPPMVEACIARNPGRPAVAKLRHALGSDVTLSRLEDAFLVLLATHDLPPPRTNVDHAGDKVDCHWPRLGLTVELLSYGYHATRQAFEEDVARRRRSRNVAFSYGDVLERTAATAEEVALLMDRRSSP